MVPAVTATVFSRKSRYEAMAEPRFTSSLVPLTKNTGEKATSFLRSKLLVVEPQPNFRGLEHVQPSAVLSWSPIVRATFAAGFSFVHPEQPEIHGLTHVMWTGRPVQRDSTARNAVFYGQRAIDRSPCGTGTSARMAQWAALGRLAVGDEFVHESIIGSLFHGRVEAAAKVGNVDAIVPSIAGWARATGLNTITIDDRDPLAHGFQVN